MQVKGTVKSVDILSTKANLEIVRKKSALLFTRRQRAEVYSIQNYYGKERSRGLHERTGPRFHILHVRFVHKERLVQLIAVSRRRKGLLSTKNAVLT